MVDAFRSVQAGEIISATRFNEILTELALLRDRVALLEAQPGGGLVHITGFVPDAAVGQQVGGELVIQGSGFETPAWNAARLFLTNEVTINNQPVPPANFVLPRCSDTELVVIIPSAVDDGSLGAAGRPVPVRVTNRFGATVLNCRVLRSAAVRPNPIINAQGDVPPGIVGPTGTATLRSGQAATVNGANFSPTVAENTVTIEVGANQLNVSGLAVDPGGTRLTFNLPANLGTPPGNPTAATLRVAVTGAAASATANCTLVQL